MKQSIFNLSYTMDGYYIILNTKTQNLIRFPREQKSLIDEILQQNIKSVNPEILKILMEKGYIIDDDVDELKEIYKQCYELVNSNILYLTIMPTYTCNLACVYCFQHHIPGAIIDDIMVHKIINAVEKNIQKYSALYLEWFGGEPLLAREQVLYMNKKFKEICNKVKVPYAARITTNGYFLDLKTFEQLYKSNCFVYYISIDGEKQTHDKQRPCKNGQGSYDKIMENLKQIKQRVPFRNFRIEIRVNCSKSSYDNFNIFLSDFEKKFGNDRRFSLVIETINDWSERTESMNREKKLLNFSDLEILSQMAKKYNVQLASTDKHMLNTQICQAAKRNAYSIFYDGTIHKCQMAQESEKFCQLEKIGNITDNGEFRIEKDKEKLWVNDVFPKLCENCKVLPICFGKKCIFQKEIQGQDCIDIEQKFLNSFMSCDSSKVDLIPLYIL